MGNIIEVHRDMEHSFGSGDQKMEYIESLVYLFRSVEPAIVAGGKVTYDVEFRSLPGKELFVPTVGIKEREMWKTPDGHVIPFVNFMTAIVQAEGILGVLRSNYFGHCDEKAWGKYLRVRADQNAGDLGDIETGRKYLRLQKGEAQIEYFTDQFIRIFAPKIQKRIGEYDSSRLYEKLDLVVST
jgi:hypothetical protein